MNNLLNPSGIQIIGTQRSGSNLLRVILDQSEEISSPHPPHILVTFVPLMPLYGFLDEAKYKILISDVVDYVVANPVPWAGIEFDKDWIFRQSTTYTLFEINRLIYETAAITKKARYWCCKSMANVHYAEELERHVADLKYIYLFRDGRDVALSFKKAIVGEKHIYHLAQQWYKDQSACIELSRRIERDRFFALNYEQLIARPVEVIQSLCRFLNISYTPSMLNFHQSEESKATAEAGEMWENLTKPIIKDNTGKFLNELTPEDIALFELINSQTLTKLGYRLVTQPNANRAIAAGQIDGFNHENALLKQHTILNARQSDLDRRSPQLEIIRRITTQVNVND